MEDLDARNLQDGAGPNDIEIFDVYPDPTGMTTSHHQHEAVRESTDRNNFELIQRFTEEMKQVQYESGSKKPRHHFKVSDMTSPLVFSNITTKMEHHQ